LRRRTPQGKAAAGAAKQSATVTGAAEAPKAPEVVEPKGCRIVEPKAAEVVRDEGCGGEAPRIRK